jgi:photosystem II stability/assembly factor-like uncharacterized protein
MPTRPSSRKMLRRWRRPWRAAAVLTLAFLLVLIGDVPGAPVGAARAGGVPGCKPGTGNIDLAQSARPGPAASSSTNNATYCGWKPAQLPQVAVSGGYALWSAAYVDPTTVVAVGDLGTILRSTNSGVSWGFVRDPAPSQDLHVVVESDGTLWAAGTNAVYLESVDGGITWTNYSAAGLEGNVTVLSFLRGADSWFGYAGTTVGVFVTRDAGSTWTELSTPVGSSLNAVAFYDPDHGWVQGGGGTAAGVYYTADGGNSWTHGSTGGQLPDSRSLVATGPTDATMLGVRDLIFQTSDGVNWSSQTLAIDLETPESPLSPALAFVGTQYGWATEQEANIFYTSNGGGCWMEEGVPTVPFLYGFGFYNATNGVAVGPGVIWYTTNGGVSGGDTPGTIGGSYCNLGPLYVPEVLGSAVGIGVGAALLSVLLLGRREKKEESPPPSAPPDRAVERQKQRTRVRSRKRFVGG